MSKPMSSKLAHAMGYRAAKAATGSATVDLESALARWIASHGPRHAADYVEGWTDWA